MDSDIDAPEGGMASGGSSGWRHGICPIGHFCKLDIIKSELGVALQKTPLALDHLRLVHAATRRVV